MDKHNYFTISAFIYLIIGIVFVLMIFNDGSAIINGYLFPVWLNWVVVIISAYLSYQSFQFKK
ncbi:MAG: hypothetical protein COW88_00670 [Candidatus Lloydbacteria bacterium CG22_combo_CG10-13_8_21_14_all_47_15]|uniref:Uncharacterized protein n=1 Tax=Candidatus Lloydbacteria bacterium CG22_combo_CG10-13_8_21_14_all_47_15 TaxID=1974635 RepID=A0A2H0CVB0_9BACT|nr:MAG: hypothetical protein COW88_00670 [Candidatus Lloydbacteria bacterium CG22_combo_CG10-13_8_21_14_all_47_15]